MFKSSKFWVFLFILVHQWVGPAFGGLWRPVPDLRRPCQVKDHWTAGWGVVMVSSLVLMQMWVTEEAGHVFWSPSWGILDQDDTRCLFQGIPDLEEPQTWCHWILHRSSDCVWMHLFASLGCTMHSLNCCDGNSLCLFTPQVII